MVLGMEAPVQEVEEAVLEKGDGKGDSGFVVYVKCRN